MTAFSRHFGLVAAFALLAGGLTLATANAAGAPDNIAEVVSEAARVCTYMKGTPNTDGVLSTKDLNGDGGDDWIVDFAKMKCPGSTNPLCSDAGCTLQIYFFDGTSEWDLVFEDFVRSYTFGEEGGNRMLYVITSGLPCNKPLTDTCKYNYRLAKDSVVPVRSAAAESSAAKTKKSDQQSPPR